MIDEGLTRGTIQWNTFPWVAAVLFAGKEDSNLGPYFEYWHLDTVTVKNKYLLPLDTELIDSCLDDEEYTKIEIENMYQTLKLAEVHKDKLALLCHESHFYPLMMPFWPAGSLGYFQYFIHNIILGKSISHHLDTILISFQ